MLVTVPEARPRIGSGNVLFGYDQSLRVGVEIVIVLESVQVPVVLYTPFNAGFPSTPVMVTRLGQRFSPVPRSVVTIVVWPFATVMDFRLPERVFQAAMASEFAIST